MANPMQNTPSVQDIRNQEDEQLKQQQNQPPRPQEGNRNKDRADKNRVGGQTAGNRGNMDRGARGE